MPFGTYMEMKFHGNDKPYFVIFNGDPSQPSNNDNKERIGEPSNALFTLITYINPMALLITPL